MSTAVAELSLYHVDAELQALIQYREDREMDTEDPMGDDERAALNGEIARYLEALPAKVEGVAAIFRMWRGQRELIKAEAERLAKLARRIEANETRLKGYVADILAMQPEPKKGCRKLVGRDGSTLSLKGNGGLEPLAIQEGILPAEYRDVTVRIPQNQYDSIRDHLADIEIDVFEVGVAPNGQRIRGALAEGEDIPGAHLEPRGAHVEVR